MKKKKIIRVGDKVSSRVFLHAAQAKKFLQTVMVMYLLEEVRKAGIPVSLRGVYYAGKRTLKSDKLKVLENVWDKQSESDAVIEDLETTFGFLREDYGVIAKGKGSIAGPIVFEDQGDVIDCTKLGSSGWTIPGIVEEWSLKIKEVSADYVLVVEKDTVWKQLTYARFWEKHNCLLVTGGGQADRATRRLLVRLQREHNLPIYILVDCDAYGWYIYSTYKHGSINLAYTNDKLAVTSSKCLGVVTSDLKEFDIPQNVLIKLEEHDKKRLQELKRYPWFQSKKWKKEIELMEKMKVKAEIDTFASKGFRYLIDVYLPTKIENKMWIE
jgi:DNA topoisomerase-6 subunit A